MVVPLTLAQANKLVARWHRHHKPVIGHRFSLGAEESGVLVGAVIVGRPKSRMTEQYRTAEVTRLVTDGSKNACSFLYGAAARVAREMGFDEIQTFILASEPGTSLRASGWAMKGTSKGGQWVHTGIAQMILGQTHGNRIGQPTEAKQKWVKRLRPGGAGAMTCRAASRSTPAAIGLWSSEIHDVDFSTYDEATNTVACDRCGQRLDANAWAKPCPGPKREE